MKVTGVKLLQQVGLVLSMLTTQTSKNMATKTHTKFQSFRTSENQKQKLKAYSTFKKVPVSKVIRTAINEYLNER